MASILKKMRSLLPLIILVVVAGSVCCSSEVMETTSHLKCCATHPTVRVKCDFTCSILEKPFAIRQGQTKGCTPPCQKIEDGLMTLDACLNCTCRITCYDEMDKSKIKEEERITYLSQPCSGPPKTAPTESHIAAGSAAPPLSYWMLVSIAALLLPQLTC